MIVVDVANVPYKGTTWCHMTDDNGDLEALDAFAQSIGLNRQWRHNTIMPHYDVTPSMKRRALKAGAVEVDMRTMVAIMKAWRRANVQFDA